MTLFYDPHSRDKALDPVRALLSGYCDGWEMLPIWPLFMGDKLTLWLDLWDGDGRPDAEWLALVEAMEAATEEAARAMGAWRGEVHWAFQSEARDPDTTATRLAALALTFPDDVRANPSARLAAVADPTGWERVFCPEE